ncbi:hypothetical protein Z945_3633 [Sulfitobacter noctilucae]|uniref:hypothetical protein n=1 Tax=Sulfitobacter noctilucae TaxID=1342302 RepID=UPI000469706D|nr:hypothetical protein [Sulfitobacter noctilucae]KIN70578.1 hypothetical protein Z945_3633 [Sulfitobacter noctilucae]
MKDLLRILLPLLVWVATFSAIYGLHGLTCSQHSNLLASLPASGLLTGAWIVAILIQTIVLGGLHHWPSASATLQRIALTLGWTAIVAMLWSLFPVLLAGCS